MTKLRYLWQKEYEDSRLFRMETCGSDIPVNIYAEPGSDPDLKEGDICTADICGVCYDLEIYPDEDAYYASKTPFAAISMVPVGVFSSEGNADKESAHIIFSGKVFEAEKDPKAGEGEINYCLRTESLEMEINVFTCFDGEIKTGSIIHGTAWIFAEIHKENAGKEQVCGKDDAVYRDERFVLLQKDGTAYLIIEGKEYELSCQPYEPCTYIKENGSLISSIHNAFDPCRAIEAFAKGESVRAITGKVYNAEEFCRMIEYAADNLFDTDISYVEGALAVGKLKSLGATGPERAVDIRVLDVRSISDSFSHSKKLKERVMYTEDGKVYLKIKQ